MRVVSYFPIKAEDQRELEKRVAMFHAETVRQYMMSLEKPKEQKLNLMQAVKDITMASLHENTNG